jgi:hypothetical protein
MITYIKKLIKKQKLLKKYKEKINDCLFLLNRYSENSTFYKCVEEDMLALCKCYNRLKKL